MLLKTWNKADYQYRRFDARHFTDIEAVLKAHQKALNECRNMSIEDMGQGQRRRVSELFEAFETILGPVGAAKTLHHSPGALPDLGPQDRRSIRPAPRPGGIEWRPLLAVHAHSAEPMPPPRTVSHLAWTTFPYINQANQLVAERMDGTTIAFAVATGRVEALAPDGG